MSGIHTIFIVSTRSRPKAAGDGVRPEHSDGLVSTRSRPKAAGLSLLGKTREEVVSTRSRPKAAGADYVNGRSDGIVSTRSRPKAAGSTHNKGLAFDMAFQHAAARRRLGRSRSSAIRNLCFNTQPPEGGWLVLTNLSPTEIQVSTRSRPKAAGPE